MWAIYSVKEQNPLQCQPYSNETQLGRTLLADVYTLAESTTSSWKFQNQRIATPQFSSCGRWITKLHEMESLENRSQLQNDLSIQVMFTFKTPHRQVPAVDHSTLSQISSSKLPNGETHQLHVRRSNKPKRLSRHLILSSWDPRQDLRIQPLS